MTDQKNKLEKKFWTIIKEADIVLNDYSNKLGFSSHWELEKLIKGFIKQNYEKPKEN